MWAGRSLQKPARAGLCIDVWDRGVDRGRPRREDNSPTVSNEWMVGLAHTALWPRSDPRPSVDKRNQADKVWNIPHNQGSVQGIGKRIKLCEEVTLEKNNCSNK